MFVYVHYFNVISFGLHLSIHQFIIRPFLWFFFNRILIDRVRFRSSRSIAQFFNNSAVFASAGVESLNFLWKTDDSWRRVDWWSPTRIRHAPDRSSNGKVSAENCKSRKKCTKGIKAAPAERPAIRRSGVSVLTHCLFNRKSVCREGFRYEIYWFFFSLSDW